MTNRILERIRHAFPPPSFITMAGAGVDISTGSVKSIVLGRAGEMLKLESFKTIPLGDGVVVGGDIEKPDTLVEILRTIRLRNKVHFAHASLLERKAFLYQTMIPHHTPDVRTAVEFSLEGHVPISPADAVFDYDVVRRVEAGVIVAVTVYARRIVSSYQDVFRRAGITLRSLEVESQAAARAICAPADSERVILVVDFGRQSTRIAVVDHGVVSFTATVDVGGDALTSAIMKQLHVSAEEAEKIKNEQGFLESEKNKTLFEALMLTISVLRDELVRHIAFWNAPAENDPPRKHIMEVRIIGGNASLKGLPEFLSRSLQLPVAVGNVWEGAFSLDEYVPSLAYRDALQYATAIGLGMRSHTRIW